jgi:hypothetical protein
LAAAASGAAVPPPTPPTSHLDAGLADADGLLLHGLVDGYLVRDVHLVKLIDAADTVVSQHQGTSLDRKLIVLRLLRVCGECRQQQQPATNEPPLLRPHTHKRTLTTLAVRPAAVEALPLV